MRKKSLKTKQLKFIEFLVYFNGVINREDIINKFNISPASATNLLSQYNKIAPNNLDYNITLKAYEISKTFKPIFKIRIFLERMPIYTIPILIKSIPDDIEKIAIISRAIHKIQVLKITYNSVSSGVSEREIIPVAFADTQLRWHLRAYDRKRQKYIDFFLNKILKITIMKNTSIKEQEHPNNDKQWHQFITLKIKSHPYNSYIYIEKNETYNVRIRSAMAGYFLRLWNVDCSHNFNWKNKNYQYILENIKEISKIADLTLAPEYNNY